MGSNKLIFSLKWIQIVIHNVSPSIPSDDAVSTPAADGLVLAALIGFFLTFGEDLLWLLTGCCHSFYAT